MQSLLENLEQQEAASILETFPNPRTGRNYLITHLCSEFTSVCPKTGQPDFATISVEYVPNAECLELKSLKLYFFSFRNKGIFYEAVINQILDDLVAACKPLKMTVTGDFNVRGGFSSLITASYPQE